MKLAEQKGQTWNESIEYRDPITLKEARRVTTEGVYSNTMGYHTGIGWSGDGENILLDGNVTDNMILSLSYEDTKIPRFEMIARHETFWGSNFGQMGHPHTTSDREGRYVAFNAVKRDGVSADAYVVEL